MSDVSKKKDKASKLDFFNRNNIIIISIVVICFVFALFINLHIKINGLNTQFEKKYENILKNNEDIVVKIDDLSKVIEKYNNIKINKNQFTEIYMQLQELTGMISNEAKREYYINKMVSVIAKTNDTLDSKAIYDISKAIYEESVKYNFNPFLITSLIKTESNFNPKAVSDAYAYGLCQVRRFIAPEIAKSIDIEWNGAEETLFDPIKNIKIGTFYLSMLSRNFEDMHTAIIAYNRGPYYVQEQLTDNKELDHTYLDKILNYYSELRGFSLEGTEAEE